MFFVKNIMNIKLLNSKKINEQIVGTHNFSGILVSFNVENPKRKLLAENILYRTLVKIFIQLEKKRVFMQLNLANISEKFVATFTHPMDSFDWTTKS